jgi:hypothetical protein
VTRIALHQEINPVAYYGRYGRGLDAFVLEWGLDKIGDKTMDPVVLEALQAVLDATSPERGYILSFVPTGTAATSFSSKRVVITSEALRGEGIVEPDRWARNQKRALAWSNGRRFRISAGMVCHEVAHVRYGQDTAGAVDRVYKGHKNLRLAQRISNILDDTRIEAAFVWDFPGFGRSLFDHVLEWVARKNRENKFITDEVSLVEDRNDALNAMLLASRYDGYYRWPFDPTGRTDLCREFGKKWAKKYTRDDTVALHLAGVKAAIDFLRQFPKSAEQKPDDTTTCPPPPAPPQSPQDEPEPEDDDPEPADETEDGDDSDDEGTGSGQGLSPDDFDFEDEDEDERGGSGEDLDDEDDDADDEERGDGGNSDFEDEDEDAEGEPKADETPAETDEDGEAVIDEPSDKVPDFDKSIESSGTAADKATNRTRDEVAKTRETISSEETHGGTVKLNRKPTAKRTYACAGKPDHGVAHEVRLAFESTRFSHDEWASGHATGRFRSRDAHRAASGDLNVFSRRENESSTRVHLAMLIDYSGSMIGYEHEEAMRFAQTVASAMDDSPVFRQSVWKYAHTGYDSNVTLDLLWQTGSPKAMGAALLDGGNPEGSTPTGEALYALGREMSDDRRSDEALLLLSITDGAPDRPAVVKYATEHWGERRIAVVGVRVGATSDERVMSDMRSQYGDDRVIEFTGSWKDLAEDVGSIIGQTLAGTL